MASSHAAAGSPDGSRNLRLIAGWAALTLLVLLLAATAWVGVRGLLAKGELENAVPLASTIQSQIASGDGDAAADTFAQFAEHSSRAAGFTSDPIWRAFEVVPFVGPNLTAVRELAAVTDVVAQDAVGPLVDIAGVIEVADFKPVDGTVDLQPLLDAQPQVAAASAALARAQDRVDAIDTSGTLSVVQDAAEKLASSVAEAAASLTAVDKAVQLVPNMLGAAGPRNYILLFPNPAELRATGGNPGALALLHTENGRIDLAQQASTSDFSFYETPVLDLPFETRNLYGEITGQYMQDVSLTPKFPLTAQLAREMWRLEFGVEADGVLSVDPIALGYLLEATGPITLATGDVLTSENAVQLLLVDAYARYEVPADQDAFFAAAAASVFSAVAAGDFEPLALVAALAKAGEERRVLVWSARDEEQAVLAGTTLAGELPVSDDDTKRFGAYLNDATGSKMGTYLDVQLGTGQSVCREDRRPVYRVQVTLTNTAPADAAETLSDYVTGGGEHGVAPGNIKTMVSVYGAPDMLNLGLTRDGETVGYLPITDSSHPVSLIHVELAPGESTVLNFDWLGDSQFEGDIAMETTPVINPHETLEVVFSCEFP